MQLGFELAAIAILMGINAFLAASEISLVSVNKMRMRSLADEGNASAVRVLALIETWLGWLEMGDFSSNPLGNQPAPSLRLVT
jgi:CBS domain containing-hemolysin-like protein